MDDLIVDEEEAEPRFLLVGIEGLQATSLPGILETIKPAAVLVDAEAVDALRTLAVDHGVALLARDDANLARQVDGIMLSDPSRVPALRSTLDQQSSERLIIGAEVGHSRHDAMVAGEEGADVIAFGQLDGAFDDTVVEIVTWWRDVTIMPCLAYADSTEAAAKLAKIGTDFIGVQPAIWRQSGDPIETAEELQAAIARI